MELAPLCSPHTRPARPSPVAQVRAQSHRALQPLQDGCWVSWPVGLCCKVCRQVAHHPGLWTAAPLPIDAEPCQAPPRAPQVLTEQVGGVVERLVDATQLCIAAGKAAWLAYLDIYVLDAGALHLLLQSRLHCKCSRVPWVATPPFSDQRCALTSRCRAGLLRDAAPGGAAPRVPSTYGGQSADGSLLDAALLAAVAALRSLQLPAVAVNEEGAVVPSSESAAAADTQPDSR